MRLVNRPGLLYNRVSMKAPISKTNFLDFHFGTGANDSFGKKFDDLAAILKQAASLAGDDKRKPLYVQANDMVRQHVPMVPVAHGGSAVAFKADVKGAQTSPLGNEICLN